jgi:hypothetical protein
LFSEVVVIVSGVATVSVKAAAAFCAGEPESVTLNVSGVAVTPAVGIPPITPVEAFNVKPGGSVPEVNCQV